MRGDERLEVSKELGVPPEREVDIDAVEDHAEPQLGDPLSLDRSRAMQLDVGYRSTAPEGERLGKQTRRLDEIAPARSLARAVRELDERTHVEVVVRDAKSVAGGRVSMAAPSDRRSVDT